ncbi:putative zinc-binding metallopeptidase [Comamonadaceae bacterium PP-2]
MTFDSSFSPLEPSVRRRFNCRCGKPVFFRNSLCIACGTALGFDPVRGDILSLAPGAEEGTWIEDGAAGPSPEVYRRCANFDTAASCNWLLPQSPEHVARDVSGTPLQQRTLCIACALNRQIPDLSNTLHATQWGKIEMAKRRLVSALLAMGLPVDSRLDQDPQRGVAFDFMSDLNGQPRVLTGHADGLVTLNIEEADDVKREKARAAMHEPYRTLLGHLRHEIGHYYWDRLVAGSDWLEDYRSLFGDERADYAAALQTHYAQGPAPDWPLHYVSAYASTHPWEDWAETWAHYLHMVDTFDTAMSFGLSMEESDIEYEPFTADMLYRPEAADAPAFLEFLNSWTRLSGVLNEISRSMGTPDFYPFVLPIEVVRKLQFVHLLVQSARVVARQPGTPLDTASESVTPPPPPPASPDASAQPVPETAGG